MIYTTLVMPIEQHPGQPGGLPQRLELAQPHRHSMIIGKEGFKWRQELSEGGQKFYKLLVKEMGDIDLLPTFAAEKEFDLKAAMEELKGHGLLDESIPGLVRLIRREIK
jgi:hypothetical protein